VGDPSDLTLFYEARHIRRHRSTDQRLHYDGVLFGFDHLDDFGPKSGGLAQAAPNFVQGRHGLARQLFLPYGTDRP